MDWAPPRSALDCLPSVEAPLPPPEARFPSPNQGRRQGLEQSHGHDRSPGYDPTDPYQLPPAPFDNGEGSTGCTTRGLPRTASPSSDEGGVGGSAVSGDGHRTALGGGPSDSGGGNDGGDGGGNLDPHDVLAALRDCNFYQRQICSVHVYPPVQGKSRAFEELASPLPRLLETMLRRSGIDELHEHQAQAIDAAVTHGHHVALSTGTSSGKSISFYVPILTAILNARRGVGCDASLDGSSGSLEPVTLYLSPTKALAQDQLKHLLQLLQVAPEGLLDVECGTLDGDTPYADRDRMLKHGQVILTNPDMLHVSVLPSHKQWHRVLSSLKYVVVDEAHTYKGVFGAHVAGVMRRLIRLCKRYGSSPQFFHCTATIMNPALHFGCLLPLNMVGGDSKLTVIDTDTSPKGKKLFAMWNPPLNQLTLNHGGGAGGGGSGFRDGPRKRPRKTKSAVGAIDDDECGVVEAEVLDAGVHIQSIKGGRKDKSSCKGEANDKRKGETRAGEGVKEPVGGGGRIGASSVGRGATHVPGLSMGLPPTTVRSDVKHAGEGGVGGFHDGEAERTSTILETARIFTV